MAVGVAGTCAPTPINQTFAGLKGAVADSMGFGGDSKVLGVAGSGINNAVRYLDHRLWSWLLTSQSITLATDTDEYTLTGNFKAPRSNELQNSAGAPKSRLGWEDPKTFSSIWTDRSISGAPRAYTVFNMHEDCLLTLNVPSSSTFVTEFPTLLLRYYKRLQTYAADGSSQTIPPEVELFLELYARWLTAAVVRPGLITTYERAWQRQETALLRSESHSQVRDF